MRGPGEALEESMGRAHAALRDKWARERAAEPEPAEARRYAMAFDCTEEEFEAVRLALAGRNLANKNCRFVPPGWIPGERL